MSDRVTKIEPGNIYVLEVDQFHISIELRNHIENEWKKRCPGTEVLVLAKSVRLHREPRRRQVIWLWAATILNLVLAISKWIF